GGYRHETATQELYVGEVADEGLHSPPNRYRDRCFGGTTTIWGGRCVPFDEIDFEPRTWVPNSGWPFCREALARYYPEAIRLCEAGHFAYTVPEAFQRPLRPMLNGLQNIFFTSDTLERFSCPTNFARRYGHRLTAAQNVRVLLHANVTAIDLNEQGN